MLLLTQPDSTTRQEEDDIPDSKILSESQSWPLSFAKQNTSTKLQFSWNHSAQLPF